MASVRIGSPSGPSTPKPLWCSSSPRRYTSVTMPGMGVVSTQRCIASSMRFSRVSLMAGFRQKLIRRDAEINRWACPAGTPADDRARLDAVG